MQNKQHIRHLAWVHSAPKSLVKCYVFLLKHDVGSSCMADMDQGFVIWENIYNFVSIEYLQQTKLKK